MKVVTRGVLFLSGYLSDGRRAGGALLDAALSGRLQSSNNDGEGGWALSSRLAMRASPDTSSSRDFSPVGQTWDFLYYTFQFLVMASGVARSCVAASFIRLRPGLIQNSRQSRPPLQTARTHRFFRFFNKPGLPEGGGLSLKSFGFNIV